ncbi:hypothetical protein [Microbulbifer yueqingensis]|uniref:Uncharacterized protein n=1 Tax=Microbulbifer yueqingensis TaxID=658219 RepID=A0A1G8UD47_9GAMM|nr:hypothetical protein [Microbulbifer yueqingensis]SDJ51524.1 hypothetical protein SAMN05216212_0069 [Microbulbifer yueqingensis]
MKSNQWAMMLAAMSPKENQTEVMNAAITSSLSMNQKNRTIFSVTQANMQATQHRRAVESAEKVIGTEVLDAVHEVRTGTVDFSCEDFKTRYANIDRLGLTDRLKKVALGEEVSGLIFDGYGSPSSAPDAEIAARLVQGLTLLAKKGKPELTQKESQAHPVLAQLLDDAQFKAAVRDLVKVAAATPETT